MPSCKKLMGAGLHDIGPIIKFKNAHQKGGNFYRVPRSHQYAIPYNLHGAGVGSVFGSILGRFIIPLLAQAGVNLLQGVQSNKDYLVSKGSEAIDKLTEKGIEKLKSLKGSGRRRIRRRKIIKAKQLPKNHHSMLAAIKSSTRRIKKKKSRKNKPSKLNQSDIFS